MARALLANWEYSVSSPVNLQFEQGTAGKLPDGVVCAGAAARRRSLGAVAAKRLQERR